MNSLLKVALNFLFHDTHFPRAIAHCLNSVEESLGNLPKNEFPLKSLRVLVQKVNAKKMERLEQEALHKFIDEIQSSIRRFHLAIEKQYFLLPPE